MTRNDSRPSLWERFVNWETGDESVLDGEIEQSMDQAAPQEAGGEVYASAEKRADDHRTALVEEERSYYSRVHEWSLHKGVKLINRRYHELKVQIADIRAERDRAKQDAALARMESGILQYEAENKTGNPVLDTLLTAKSMDCQEKQIQMTSVADGRALNFLTTREICTIVGTALDNAIESCAAEPDPEKRLIRTAVYVQNGFVMFRFENYCAEPVELGPDGLPARSTHGGYDLKSLRALAQQHGGSMTVHWENRWFTVRMLLPLPKKA